MSGNANWKLQRSDEEERELLLACDQAVRILNDRASDFPGNAGTIMRTVARNIQIRTSRYREAKQ